MKKIVKFQTVFSIRFSVFLFSGISRLNGEDFRVTKAQTIRFRSVNPESETINLGYNDGVALVLPDDLTFIKAVEFEIKTPREVLQFPGGMAYGIYTNLSSLPDGEIFDFSAEQLSIEILPSKVTFVLQLPLRENHGLKSDPYALVMAPIRPEDSAWLFFRLFPVMKGMPEEVENAVFPVKIKPILIDEGGFKLSVKYTDSVQPGSGEQNPGVITPNVRIDEIPVQNPGKIQLLSPGSHHLAVSAENYRTEVRVFTVEQAKITEVTVEMKDTAPTVVFAGPDNAEILLDGEKIDNPRESRKIKPGKHLVVFSVGDYKLQKQFTAEEGRDYSVSMTVDAEIVELE